MSGFNYGSGNEGEINPFSKISNNAIRQQHRMKTSTNLARKTNESDNRFRRRSLVMADGESVDDTAEDEDDSSSNVTSSSSNQSSLNDDSVTNLRSAASKNNNPDMKRCINCLAASSNSSSPAKKKPPPSYLKNSFVVDMNNEPNYRAYSENGSSSSTKPIFSESNGNNNKRNARMDHLPSSSHSDTTVFYPSKSPYRKQNRNTRDEVDDSRGRDVVGDRLNYSKRGVMGAAGNHYQYHQPPPPNNGNYEKLPSFKKCFKKRYLLIGAVVLLGLIMYFILLGTSIEQNRLLNKLMKQMSDQ